MKHRATYIIGFLLSVAMLVGFVYLTNTDASSAFVEQVHTNYILVVVGAILFKTMGTMYPPLNGQALTILLIPLIGWLPAYIIDLVGNMVGVVISFLLGKKYGKRLIRKITGEKIFNKITGYQIKSENQIRSVVLLRLASFGLSDLLAWFASLMGVQFKPLVIGSLINHPLMYLPIYFLLGKTIETQAFLVAVPIGLIAFFVIWKLRHTILIKYDAV